MESMVVEAILLRIEEKQAAIEQRLISLEQRVEQITAPPEAYSIEDAAKIVQYGPTAFRELIRKGIVRTVQLAPGAHPRVPKSELVRITTVVAPRPRPAPGPRPKKAGAPSEADEIRALAKKR